MVAPHETTGAYRALGALMARWEVAARRHGTAAARGELHFVTVVSVLLLGGALFLPTADLSDGSAVLLSVLALIPLAFVLLLTAGTVQVLWRDSPGRPWLVTDHVPPGVKLPAAARVWYVTDTTELAEFLGSPSAKDTRARRLHEILAHLERTPALRRMAVTSGRHWKLQVADGYRRVPKGIVRQGLSEGLTIGACIAAVAVRQTIAQQTPVAGWAALITTVLAVGMVALGASLIVRARPLTRRGKILRQHLEGLRTFIRQTRTAERIDADDPLLPYALLFASVSEARGIVQRLYPYDGPLSRDPRALTTARFAFRVVCCALGAVTGIVLVWVAATSIGALGYAAPLEVDSMPIVWISAACGLAVAGIGAGLLVASRRHPPSIDGGWLRDAGVFAAPVVAGIGFTLFAWLAGRDVAVLDNEGMMLVWTGAAGLAGLLVIFVVLSVRRERRAARSTVHVPRPD